MIYLCNVTVLYCQDKLTLIYCLYCHVMDPYAAAALIHNFDVCTGIEILEELHKGALDVAAIYENRVSISPLMSTTCT
jgi:hypothetical protein